MPDQTIRRVAYDRDLFLTIFQESADGFEEKSLFSNKIIESSFWFFSSSISKQLIRGIRTC